ncbi:MAG TPA: hydrogenase nickel incorporation protein HypB [Methylocella sp.]|nr:hydrogenase nickel incorporation protein HypB [Methylocella sp.]
MCATCGCEGEVKASVLNLQTGHAAAPSHEHDHNVPIGQGDPHEHVHADGTRHSHPHELREHEHGHGGETITIEQRILAKNDALAAKTRAWLSGREILALNLVSSPGAGKTTLLERSIAGLASEFPLFVIEGDQATAKDGERIRAAGAPVVQVNTGTGCHLDAEMVARGLRELKPGSGAVLFIENVGNLVCPALFDLGERAKVVIFSVTEGEDKPLKYPHMFRAAELVIFNKIDLLPYVDFSMAQALSNLREVNADATTFELSARTGEGLNDWFGWIRRQAALARQFAFLETDPLSRRGNITPRS